MSFRRPASNPEGGRPPGGLPERPNAYPIYLLYCTLVALLRYIHHTTAAVYYVTTVGLSPLQLVLVGTTLMGVILVSEVPTGVIADVFSRRLSVIIGTALIGAGFLIEGLIPTFAAILVTQVVWGVGITFTSGALEAWIADEQAERTLDVVFVRGAQAGNLGALAGIIISVALASVRLSLPLVVAGAGLLALALLLAVLMPERHFRPAAPMARSSLAAASQTLRASVTLVWGRPVLMTIMGVTFFFAMASETYDRLWELHFLRHFTFPELGQLQPVVWFGIINAGGMLLSVLVVELVRRWLHPSGQRGLTHVLVVITVVLLAAMVGFGLAGTFGAALLWYWAAYLMRRTYEPLYTAWLNQGLDPQVRATVNSLAGQVDALGQIAGGPPFGWIATAASTRVAMVAAGLTLTPTLLLYGRARRQGPMVVSQEGEMTGAS